MMGDDDMMECPTCEGTGECPFCAGQQPQTDCPYGHDGCDNGTCIECDGEGEVIDPEAYPRPGGHATTAKTLAERTIKEQIREAFDTSDVAVKNIILRRAADALDAKEAELIPLRAFCNAAAARFDAKDVRIAGLREALRAITNLRGHTAASNIARAALAEYEEKQDG